MGMGTAGRKEYSFTPMVMRIPGTTFVFEAFSTFDTAWLHGAALKSPAMIVGPVVA